MYSKLVSFECFNFMSIRHGVCEFDESGIINLKGYNDSGKTAVLTALRVLLCNSMATKHVDFIQDEQDYFRIMARFDDGVLILRDKYLNGQSLYEMYKDNQLLFSTKSASGALTTVSKVPEPIADYLGLISYDNVYLNARSCKEDALGVDTTGSQNYKMFSKVLKSEESARAVEMLNNDRNRLVADMNGIDSDIAANKKLLGECTGITGEVVDALKTLDACLDGYIAQEQGIGEVVIAKSALDSVKIPPEVGVVDDVKGLLGVCSSKAELDGIVVTPELPELLDVRGLMDICGVVSELSEVCIAPEVCTTNSLEDLMGICAVSEELSDLVVPPEVPQMTDMLVLVDAVGVVRDLNECQTRLSKIEEESVRLQKELDSLLDEAHGYVKCPNCGHLFREGEAHEEVAY